jgi:hypothetical protein
MSYHHSNRVIEHPEAPELVGLTPLARLVLLTIAQKINPKDPRKYRFSAETLAYFTGASENACQRAAKALVEAGVLSAERDRARQANLYTLLLECPEDCPRKRHHYTPKELSERLSMSPLNDDLEQLRGDDLDPMPPLNEGTIYKQLINNLKTTNKQTVKAHSKRQPSFSFSEFEKILYETVDEADTYDHTAVANDPERAYEIALKRITEEATKRPVNSPSGLIRRIYITNPRSLLGGLPGTKPSNPDFKGEALADRKPATREQYLETIAYYCENLGIDYETELAASTKDTELWIAFTKGNLSLPLIVQTYNRGKSADEWIAPEGVGLY